MHSLFKLTHITVGILLAFSLSSHVYAEGPHHEKSGEHCNRPPVHTSDGLPPFLLDIGLSKSQKNEIAMLMKQDHVRFEGNHKQRMTLMKSLHALSNAQTFDEKQAESIASEIANLEKEELIGRAKNGHQIFLLLTPEQRKMANDNIQKHIEKKDMMMKNPASFIKKNDNFINKINA